MDEDSNSETEATPQPEGPPKLPMSRMDTPQSQIWEDDSLPSLPPVPSPPLEYSADSPLGVLVDTSLFSDKSLEDRLHRTLNRVPDRFHNYDLPTLEVARLVQQVELLRETNQELRKEKARMDKLVEARMTAELREREARQECVALKKDLEQSVNEIEELRAQIDALQKKRSPPEAEQASEQARRELSSLQSQNASLELERNDLAKELEDTKTILAKAVADTEARMTKSTEVGVQTDSLHVQNRSCQTEAVQSNDSVTSDRVEALVSEAVNRIVNQDDGHFNSIPIGERLYRIREAAERASLLREHQREISRLVAEHESEKNTLQQNFEKEKDNLLEEAMLEMNAGYKGLRQRLEKDHDKKIEEMDRKHREVIKRIREEADSAAATAAESLEVALAQVASAKQRCERETKKRNALEIRLDELQKEFNSQKMALADKLGNGWDEKRRSLIEILQNECNAVFDRNKNTASPRSVSADFFTDIQLAERQQHVLSPQQTGDRSAPEVVSPTFSELDRTLRETEALVEMVLNGNLQAKS